MLVEFWEGGQQVGLFVNLVLEGSFVVFILMLRMEGFLGVVQKFYLQFLEALKFVDFLSII